VDSRKTIPIENSFPVVFYKESFVNYRSMIAALAAGAILAGCGQASAPTQGDVLAAVLKATQLNKPQTLVGHTLPRGTRHDLVYVAGGGTLYAYAFPNIQKSPVATISVIARGLCSDADGYLWASVQDPPEMLKYRHGGTKQTAQLTKGLSKPSGCSVDPTSGDLAVVNEATSSKPTFLAVYRNGKGSPDIYRDSNFAEFVYCAYDSTGNLVIQGVEAGSKGDTTYDELAEGSQTLQSVDLTYSEVPGGVQWDGSNFAVSYLDSDIIYRYSIANGQATLTAQTQLAVRGDVGIQQFGVQGAYVAAVTGPTNDNQIATYPYPSGSPISHHHPVAVPFALTISSAPKSN
jgi:hypothetical protein